MKHDTKANVSTLVSAEEQAILGRFAERASKAADVATTDDGSYAAFALFALI